MISSRRATAVAALAVLALPLTACGSSDSSTSAATPAAAGGSSGAGKATKVTYIPGVTGNPFYTSVECGARSVADKLNVDFNVQGAPKYDAALQIPIVDAVVATKPDAIMIAMADAKALVPPLQRAKDAGIKVLMVDGDLDKPDIAIYNAQSDNEKGGALAGEEMAKALSEKGKVLAVLNNPTSVVSAARLKGFEDAIAKHPGMTYLGPQYSMNQTVNASNILTSTLSANPDLGGVFTPTTNNTEGVANGIKSSGKKGKITLIGFDTSDPIVKSIQDGTVSGDIVQAPYTIGQLELEAAVKAVKGESVDRQVRTDFVYATPENIDTPEVQKFIYKVRC